MLVYGGLRMKKDIFEAIKNSNLGKYQKDIDKCNKKRGCNSMCTLEEQRGCPKLIRHSKEMSKIDYLSK
jgi:hypothetical protein